MMMMTWVLWMEARLHKASVVMVVPSTQREDRCLVEQVQTSRRRGGSRWRSRSSQASVVMVVPSKQREDRCLVDYRFVHSVHSAVDY